MKPDRRQWFRRVLGLLGLAAAETVGPQTQGATPPGPPAPAPNYGASIPTWSGPPLAVTYVYDPAERTIGYRDAEGNVVPLPHVAWPVPLPGGVSVCWYDVPAGPVEGGNPSLPRSPTAGSAGTSV